jgi:peptidoglycan/LPS O-acetylase OafA/YrhL
VRALEWRPLALVGVASYSLYLWHVPILDALGGPHAKQLLLGTPACLAVAFASYRLSSGLAVPGTASPLRPEPGTPSDGLG